MRKAMRGVRDAAGARRADRLPAGAVPQPVLLPDRGSRALRRWPSRFPGPSTERARSAGRASSGVVIIASLFEKRAEGLYHNTAAIIDADGQLPRQVPEDAHPGRSALLREVLLHPGRPRLPQLGHPLRPDRRAGLLGPVVPRGGAAHRAERRRDPVLPHGHRLAPAGEGGARRAAAGAPGRRSSAATRSPTASTSARSTASATRATPTGGIEFWGGSFVADPGGRVLVKGGTGEEVLIVTVRPRQGGREPHPLAVPARPPHRRLQDLTRRYLD